MSQNNNIHINSRKLQLFENYNKNAGWQKSRRELQLYLKTLTNQFII